ncbi:MAG: hypothetical protein IJD04_00085 [Desulfovibrionaceae bacterium]|nr:hypothetical protein [Desulfovibrionaceae bacterium]
MNKGLRKLDEALRLGNKELACLQAGEVEEAELHAKKRIAMVREAGLFFEADIADDFKAKLIEMQALQLRLTAEAKKLYASLQEEFKQGKQNARQQRAYSKALVSGAMTVPMYMDRTS